MKIAVMQPYFAPYLGYFRLISEIDVFVIYDDAQHIRRGWVHRNRLKNRHGNLEWLTLPLEYAPQSAKINEMRFSKTNALIGRLYEKFNKFPALDLGRLPHEIELSLCPVGGTLVPYLTNLLWLCAKELGIHKRMMLASDLEIPEGIHGQDRILAICKTLGATHYLNSPGGRSLYDLETFKAAGVTLEFLSDWTGSFESVLDHLAN